MSGTTIQPACFCLNGFHYHILEWQCTWHIKMDLDVSFLHCINLEL